MKSIILIFYAILIIVKCDMDMKNKTYLELFFGNSTNNRRTYRMMNATNLLLDPEFNKARETVFYFPGLYDELNSESVKTIVSAYQKRGDHNIVVFNWERYSNEFFKAYFSLLSYDDYGSDMFLDLKSKGLNFDKVHLVSHSFGSHLAGLIARKIIEKTKGETKVKRITALDPSFQFFYPNIIIRNINADDAKMVDVIHTDAWNYGTPFSTGSVDFWPNGGSSLQPGCPMKFFNFNDDVDYCSHRRSWKLYAESVADPSSNFLAVKCTWINFLLKNCGNSEVAEMGIDCPNVKGDFYLQTYSTEPFAKGQKGIQF